MVDQARSKSSKAAIVLQSSERTSKRVGLERCAGPSSPFWAWTLASGLPHNNPVSGTPKTEQRHSKENQRSLRSGFHLQFSTRPDYQYRPQSISLQNQREGDSSRRHCSGTSQHCVCATHITMQPANFQVGHRLMLWSTAAKIPSRRKRPGRR